MSIKNLVEMIKHNGLLSSMSQLEKLYQAAIENEQKLAELEAHLAALAAENALLKKSEPAPFSKLMMEALDIYQTGADEVPELAMLSAYKKLRDGLKTSATAAFLAEVRARAIDSLVDIKTKQLADMHPDTHAFGATAMTIRSQINELQVFADQIRKGVQS